MLKYYGSIGLNIHTNGNRSKTRGLHTYDLSFFKQDKKEALSMKVVTLIKSAVKNGLISKP